MTDVRARKYQSLVLEALQSAGQQPVAKAMCVSEPTITRLKNDHLENFCELLAHVGLKVVPQDMQCYRPQSIASILQLAKERMEQIEGPEALEWNE